MRISSILLLAFTFSAFASGSPDAQNHPYGPLYEAAPQLDASQRQGPRRGLDPIRRWNQIAINASGLDHTPPAPGENRIFQQQFGPGRASRAMAIVHIAMFDAVNALVGEYRSYTGVQSPHGAVSLQAAISQAAHDPLSALFSAQAASFDTWLAEDLAGVKNKIARENGIYLGKRTAAAILALKADDGSEIPEPLMGIGYITSD